MIPYYFAEKESKGRYVVYLKYLGGGNRYPIEEFSTANAARAFVRRRNAAA
jgi:hypothetical protein